MQPPELTNLRYVVCRLTVEDTNRTDVDYIYQDWTCQSYTFVGNQVGSIRMTLPFDDVINTQYAYANESFFMVFKVETSPVAGRYPTGSTCERTRSMTNHTTELENNPYIDSFRVTNLLDAMVRVSPFIQIGEGSTECIYCGSDVHLNNGKHFYDCPYAAAQDYINRAIILVKQDHD